MNKILWLHSNILENCSLYCLEEELVSRKVLKSLDFGTLGDVLVRFFKSLLFNYKNWSFIFLVSKITFLINIVSSESDFITPTKKCLLCFKTITSLINAFCIIKLNNIKRLLSTPTFIKVINFQSSSIDMTHLFIELFHPE